MAIESAQCRRDQQEKDLLAELAGFSAFGSPTRVSESAFLKEGARSTVPVFLNEFWTAKQRQGHSLHEVSYRACFKPQLPAFFIHRLTREDDVVFDPFLGRGTTSLETALLGRVPWACDINPLSRILLEPRLSPPTLEDVRERLDRIDCTVPDLEEELLVFFHPKTLGRIMGLRSYFLENEDSLDPVDQWIRMVAINRLTGHSPGFFSVYSLPPNQAVSIQSQKKINQRRDQSPPDRDVDRLILRKTKSLLRNLEPLQRELLRQAAKGSRLLSRDSRRLPELPDAGVSLSVTSPPFLDVVDYAGDNWLRCWFAGIDPSSVSISITKDLGQWRETMTGILREVLRITKPGGWMAFEVGEVRNGKVKLEEHVLPCGLAAGWTPVLVLINSQEFTKTSNCWGIANNARGTNTNRIVLLRKPLA